MNRRADRRRIHWDILLFDVLIMIVIVLTVVWASHQPVAP